MNMRILPPPAESPSVARDRRKGVHGAGDLQGKGGKIEVLGSTVSSMR